MLVEGVALNLLRAAKNRIYSIQATDQKSGHRNDDRIFDLLSFFSGMV